MRILFYLLLILPQLLIAQEGRGDLRFIFYNVENLFDPFDDSLRIDEEFLPGSQRHWTWERFLDKEQKIYKVLVSAGGWKPAELIGLCEVENRFVLNWLVGRTALIKYNYKIIHSDSPDERGIDVALLYLPSKFRVLEWRAITVGYCCGPEGNHPKDDSVEDFEKKSMDPTRDILFVKGLAMERDTVHIVICHWPSRWEGYLESLPSRMLAAQSVKCLLDSLWTKNPLSRILVAGDLNDELGDPSLKTILKVRDPGDSNFDTCLYNTGSDYSFKNNPGYGISGTLKYRGKWYEFDHILVSGFFLKDTLLYVKPGGKIIHAPDFLLERDASLTGRRPYRTFNAYKYSGGFSDHLPVYIDLWQK